MNLLILYATIGAARWAWAVGTRGTWHDVACPSCRRAAIGYLVELALAWPLVIAGELIIHAAPAHLRDAEDEEP